MKTNLHMILAVLAALCLDVAQGLVSQSVEVRRLRVAESLGTTLNSSHLPEPEDFHREWSARRFTYPPPGPLPQEVQLVLGVFSMERFPDKDYVVKTIRDTWMRQPQVCLLNNGQQPGCTVYTAFILGARMGRAPPYADEELVLGTGENLNYGKTFSFFNHVTQKFPWATHYGKMDLDTYPDLWTLTWSLQRRMSSRCEHFVGRSWICTPGDTFWNGFYCPPLFCGRPIGEDFFKYRMFSDQCWSYMQGGLYVLSAKLAKGAAASNGTWSRNRIGIEDALTGRMVSIWARKTKTCITAWDPKAYYHDP